MLPQLPMSGAIYQPGAPTRWLTHFLHVPAEDIAGCSDAEIAEIEKAAGRALPTAYRRWMIEAGRGVRSDVGEFRRSRMTYPEVLSVRARAAEALEGWGDPSLLDRALPIFNWEFWCTYLLDLSQPWEDPPVLMLNADKETVERVYPSFSTFMAVQVFNAADGIAMLRALRS